MLRGAQLIPRAHPALCAPRRTACAPRTARARRRAGVAPCCTSCPARCSPQAMMLAHPPAIALAKPHASRCLNSPAASAAGLFVLAGPRFRLLSARSFSQNAIRLRFNRPGSVAPEASNAFPQVTAPHATPLATRRALKRRRIAFPARLRVRPRVSCPSAAPRACNACASAAFRACFASVEALLTRTLSGRPRILEPTMQTVQTDRSTLAR